MQTPDKWRRRPFKTIPVRYGQPREITVAERQRCRSGQLHEFTATVMRDIETRGQKYVDRGSATLMQRRRAAVESIPLSR